MGEASGTPSENSGSSHRRRRTRSEHAVDKCIVLSSARKRCVITSSRIASNSVALAAASIRRCAAIDADPGSFRAASPCPDPAADPGPGADLGIAAGAGSGLSACWFARCALCLLLAAVASVLPLAPSGASCADARWCAAATPLLVRVPLHAAPAPCPAEPSRFSAAAVSPFRVLACPLRRTAVASVSSVPAELAAPFGTGSQPPVCSLALAATSASVAAPVALPVPVEGADSGGAAPLPSNRVASCSVAACCALCLCRSA